MLLKGKSLLVLVLAVFLNMAFWSCTDSFHAEEGGKTDSLSVRTIVMYVVAENSLAGNLENDVRELLDYAPSMDKNQRIVLYVDDTDLPRIYCINSTTKAKSLEDSSFVAEKKYTSDKNSCDASVLKEVVSYAVRNHPASSYGLIFWSHATGWVLYHESAGAKLRTSFGVDNQHNKRYNSGAGMNISDMAAALEGFPKFDFIFFDACFMQCAESGYELRNTADYIIGSPAEIPGIGAPYDKVMPLLFKADINYQSVITQYNDYCVAYDGDGVPLSVIKCSQLDAFAAHTVSYLKQYQAYIPFVDFSKVQNYFNYDKYGNSYPSYNKLPDFYDATSFMKELLPEIDYNIWKQSLDKLVDCSVAPSRYFSSYVNGTVAVDASSYSGVSMFVPQSKFEGTNLLTDYYNSSFWTNN